MELDPNSIVNMLLDNGTAAILGVLVWLELRGFRKELREALYLFVTGGPPPPADPRSARLPRGGSPRSTSAAA